jgi:hypothetical protein
MVTVGERLNYDYFSTEGKSECRKQIKEGEMVLEKRPLSRENGPGSSFLSIVVQARVD